VGKLKLLAMPPESWSWGSGKPTAVVVIKSGQKDQADDRFICFKASIH